MEKTYVYTLNQDKENTKTWYFTLYTSDVSKPILLIKVNSDNGRFTLRKSANLNLKIVSGCMAKLLEILRSHYKDN